MDDRPQAAVDFAFQLPGPPAHVTDEKARVLRRLLDHLVDGRGAESDIQVLHERQRAFPGTGLRLDDRNQGTGGKRTAVAHRLGDLLGGLVLREKGGQRPVGRPVQDYADVAAARDGRRNQYSMEIARVAKGGICHQEDRVFVTRLVRLAALAVRCAAAAEDQRGNRGEYAGRHEQISVRGPCCEELYNAFLDIGRGRANLKAGRCTFARDTQAEIGGNPGNVRATARRCVEPKDPAPNAAFQPWPSATKTRTASAARPGLSRATRPRLRRGHLFGGGF